MTFFTVQENTMDNLTENTEQQNEDSNPGEKIDFFSPPVDSVFIPPIQKNLLKFIEKTAS